ncbi:MAG: phosphoribosyltransferase [Desulforegulaceae bacterium]|nr:phosphoribosyltransferase [Desulforegulaceae bacterium]
MLKKISSAKECGLYKIEDVKEIDCFIATTPQTREIANNPLVMGVDYTIRLENACCEILKNLCSNKLLCIEENETIIFNILRGGLNFGLREALYRAFGWNRHGCSFISAQRARKDDDPQKWHIIENEYAKVYMPERASIVIGDVVATGTSLEHAVKALVREAQNQKSQLRSILFFTFGGKRALEILKETDKLCRKIFPGYEKTTLIYHEGCFTVPDENTALSIKETGTDLVCLDALMAPEFIESKYENPGYPLQRCAVYDAGSRAFWTHEYIKDVFGYWSEMKKLADKGVSFEKVLKERFPVLDYKKFKDADLIEICKKQLCELGRLFNSNLS